MKKKRMYVSDLIGNEYRKWKSNDIITINCQTGQGKTYFILNVYAKYKNTKKILFLVNRSKLKEQIKKNIRDLKLTNVTVMTYQMMQELIIKNEFKNEYDILVCDEIHYMIADSWNDKSDISWRYIINECDNKTRIFMTATGEVVFGMINRVCDVSYSYKTESDYDYIKKVVFFKGDKNNSYITENIAKVKRKAIYFSTSAERAYKMHLLYKAQSNFMCSKANKDFSKYANQNAIQDEKFDSKYLMATKVIDNGVNITDRDVKDIFCDIMDSTTLIQCIGRKRIVDGRDKLTLHLKDFSAKDLQGKINLMQSYIDKADAYIFNIEQNKMNKDEKEIPILCYVDKQTDKIKINLLRYAYTKSLIEEYTTMKEIGFSTYILNILNIDKDRVIYEEMEKMNMKKDEIGTYLENICGDILVKCDQEQLINLIDLRDSRNRQQKSIKQLNIYLEENGYKYEIISTKKTINGVRLNVWIVLEK